MKNKKKTVIFLHIPKAAGTTLHHIIERQYHPKKIHKIDGTRFLESVNEFKQLPEEQRKNYDIISGHMHFGLHKFLPQPSTYFTLLRHPIKRIISHYYFVLNTPVHFLHQTVTSQNLNLEDYVSQGLSLELDNGQTRLLSTLDATEDKTIAYGQCPSRILERAKANLEKYFSVVGITEEFDKTLLLLKKNLGWNNILYASQNQGNKKSQNIEISSQTLEIIKKYNQLDLELYEYAKTLFYKQIENQDLDREFKDFQFRNKKYGKIYDATTSFLTRVRRKIITITSP